MMANPLANFYSLALVILTLFASSNVYSEVSAETQNSMKKKIVFLGDSLTAGYGLEVSDSFPSLIQNKINAENLPYSVVNAGISGDTSAGGLSRIAWVLEENVSVFVLALGANDALRGFPSHLTKKNLSAIIDFVKTKDPKIKILLVGMFAPPNMGVDYSSDFKSMFMELASEKKVGFFPFLLEGVASQRELNLNDGIHPNEKGYKIIAENIWKSLKPLL